MIIFVLVAIFATGVSLYEWSQLVNCFEAQMKFKVNLIILFVVSGLVWQNLELEKIKKQIKANEKPTS